MKKRTIFGIITIIITGIVAIISIVTNSTIKLIMEDGHEVWNPNDNTIEEN